MGVGVLNSVKANRSLSSNILKARIWKGLELSMLAFLLGAAEAPVPLEPEGASLSKTVERILRENKACIAIDDGCITCAVNGAELVCSTPRITCIPRELECTLSFKSDDDEGNGK